MSLFVAVQVYSVRDDAAANLRATFEKIKKMGYEGVELAGLYGYEPEEIKKICEEVGLNPISAHVPYAELLKDTEAVLKKYAVIGCKYIAVPYLSESYRPGTDAFPEVIENIKKIGKCASDMGLKLTYHNHDFEFVKLDGKYALDVLYEEVPAEYLGTEIDTCWVKVAGEDPAAYLRKYAGRTDVVHLKDFVGEKSENMYELIGIDKTAEQKPKTFEFRPVGSGVQNFPEIIKVCEEIGASWIVVEQDQATMGLTPMESIEKSREYLKTLGY